MRKTAHVKFGPNVAAALGCLVILAGCSAATSADDRFKANYRTAFIKKCLDRFNGTGAQKQAETYCTCAGTELTRRLTTTQLTELGLHVASKSVQEVGRSITRTCANQASRTTPQ